MAQFGTFGRRESLVLNARTFEGLEDERDDGVMSVAGTAWKTAILLDITLASGAWAWVTFAGGANPGFLFLWLALGTPATFLVALITAGDMPAARFTAPLYALLQGGILGSLAAIVDEMYPGVAILGVLLTFGTLAGLLLIYCASGFQVTAKFRAGVAAATLAIALVYAVSLGLQLMGIQSVPFLHQSGPIGMGYGLFILIIAALNLVMDFDLIETGAREGAPAYMEWYAAFGLMVSLIWVYLQVLELAIRVWASRDHDDD